jgi:hypothetical protein
MVAAMDDQSIDRFNTIIRYIREEKQKETELRMNAELELQRVKAQTSIGQQKILSMEADLLRVRNEAQVWVSATGCKSRCKI